MYRNTLFFFDILSSKSRRSTKQIQLPLIEDNLSQNEKMAIMNVQSKRINDQSMTGKNKKKSKFYQCCVLLQRSVPVTRPESTVLLFWNFINLFIILYNFIEIPIIIFVARSDFKNHEQKVFLQTMEIISIVGLLLDMILIRFKIGYYKNQEFISSYTQLIPKYLKIQFIFDIIPFISLIVYTAGTGMNFIYVKILFYLKLFTLLQINKQIEMNLLFDSYRKAFYRFLRMVYFIFFVTSLQACIYFYVDLALYNQQGFYYQNGYLWLTGSEATNQMNLIELYTWPVWYSYALFWAVQTSSTVGYGNMTPRNSPEVLLCNLVMITTVCMFIIFARTVIDIVNELQQNNVRRQDKLINLNYFSRVYDVNDQSKVKLQLFVQSLIKENEQDDEKDIVDNLSVNLQIEFHLAYKQQFFNNLAILKMLTWEKGQWNLFAKDIISEMKYVHYSNGDFIIKDQITDHFMLGFITRGKVTVMNKINFFKKDYREWEYFGQKQFFFGGRTYNQIICRSFTKFYYFQQSIFMGFMKKYQELRDTYCQSIDAVRFDKKQSQQFGLLCEHCDQLHLLQNCPISQDWRVFLNQDTNNITNQTVSHQRQGMKRNHLASSKVRDFVFPKELSIDKIYNSSCYLPYANL